MTSGNGGRRDEMIGLDPSDTAPTSTTTSGQTTETGEAHRRVPIAHPCLDGNEATYLLDCIKSGWISSAGSFVAQFEADFAAFCGVPDAVSCATGTAALHLAMAAVGIGPGDEVIVPSLTYIATANAVSYCGATPVFVDSDAETMNLDPTQVEGRVTTKTRAIVPVHLYGQCADMGPILEIANARNLLVIEDAAEAHGAGYQGYRAGSMGTAGAFSFFGNKIIATGEGGMVTLRDPGLAERIRSLRNQGVDPRQRYWHPTIGFNYRMTNLQAAVGVAQLERVDRFLQARASVASWYDEDLVAVDDRVIGPKRAPDREHVYWMYCVILADAVRLSRDELILRLKVDGIDTRPVFPPVHLMPPYAEADSSYPVAERLGARGLCLPTHSELTRDDVAYIASRLRAHLGT